LDFDVEHTSHSENEKARILHVLEEYLKYGGLPEIVLSPEDKKHEIANSYYQTVVRRDIIERNRVKNEETLKALMRLLLNSTSYSVSKLYNTLKSLNYAIGKTTLQQYIAHIEQSYFAFSVPIFSYKIKDRLLYPRKIYFIDTIFINLFSTKFSKNYGKTYENTVAVELKRNLKYNEEIYYWKSGNSEVDFVVEQNAKIRQLIQVCYDVSDITTKERETRALIKASKELKCSKLAIITEDYENEELISWFGTEKKIKFIPLWKWLLTTR
jgi:predicted AAA+ superfamily ATPase